MKEKAVTNPFTGVSEYEKGKPNLHDHDFYQSPSQKEETTVKKKVPLTDSDLQHPTAFQSAIQHVLEVWRS